MRDFLAQLPLVILLLGVTALLSWLPATHALALGDHAAARAFFYPGLILLVLAMMLGLAMRDRPPTPHLEMELGWLIGLWLVLPLFMAVPVKLAVPGASWLDAWFDMISALTTTGASAFVPDDLPPSINLWRALIGWSGGLLTLVMIFAILIPLNLGGGEVLFGRAAEHRAAAEEGASRRFGQQLVLILPLYAGFTLLLWVLLLIAGERGLPAVAHAMGTLSTSGIRVETGPGTGGFAAEAIMLVFFILALNRQFLRLDGGFRRQGWLRRDPEIRLGLGLIVLAGLVLTLAPLAAHLAAGTVETPGGLFRAFWGALFTAASYLTTTGYDSVFWPEARGWTGPAIPAAAMIGLVMIGGGIGTLTGGVKLLRVYALYLHGRFELERTIYPSVVSGEGMRRRQLVERSARPAWMFLMMFAITMIAVLFALTLTGESFVHALVLAVSALTTTGQLATNVLPPESGYATLAPAAKVILGVAMVIGRLGILAVLAVILSAIARR